MRNKLQLKGSLQYPLVIAITLLVGDLRKVRISSKFDIDRPKVAALANPSIAVCLSGIRKSWRIRPSAPLC